MKKLIIILIAVVVLLGGAGAGFMVFMSKKKAAAAAEDGEGAEEVVEKKHDKHEGPPTFVPLDPFVVNLADKGADRYAQVGVTFQISDHKLADQMKAYMPAIRDAILLILQHKTSDDLRDRAGKEALADEILTASIHAMELDDTPAKKAEAKKHPPIQKVLFANFIIQ